MSPQRARLLHEVAVLVGLVVGALALALAVYALTIGR